jgi:hypothetical protein
MPQVKVNNTEVEYDPFGVSSLKSLIVILTDVNNF